MSEEPSRLQTRSVTRAAAIANVLAPQALDSNLSEMSVRCHDAEYSEEALGFNLLLAVTAANDSDLSESNRSLLRTFIENTPSKEGSFNAASAIIECGEAEILEQLASWLRRMLYACDHLAARPQPLVHHRPCTIVRPKIWLSPRTPQPVKANRS